LCDFGVGAREILSLKKFQKTTENNLEDFKNIFVLEIVFAILIDCVLLSL